MRFGGRAVEQRCIPSWRVFDVASLLPQDHGRQCRCPARPQAHQLAISEMKRGHTNDRLVSAKRQQTSSGHQGVTSNTNGILTFSVANFHTCLLQGLVASDPPFIQEDGRYSPFAALQHPQQFRHCFFGSLCCRSAGARVFLPHDLMEQAARQQPPGKRTSRCSARRYGGAAPRAKYLQRYGARLVVHMAFVNVSQHGTIKASNGQ